MPSYAIGDVHGCLKTLDAMLARWNLGPEDQLLFLGDLIDRGPDSKGVIDRVRSLEEDPDGPQVVALMGNHEVLLLESLFQAQQQQASDDTTGTQSSKEDAPLDSDKSPDASTDANELMRPNAHSSLEVWQRNGGDKTLVSFGLSPEGEDLDRFPNDYRDWLAKRPVFLQTEREIFVHAGLNLEHPEPLKDALSMLWTRNWVDERILKERFPDTLVVHGHTPVQRWVIESRHEAGRPSLDIDAGCVYHGSAFGEGFLCAMEFPARTLHFQANVEA
jgi:serine/threonine protein phosphatase 1